MTTTANRGAATAALAARLGLKGNFKGSAADDTQQPTTATAAAPKPIARGRAAAVIRLSQAMGLKCSFSHQPEAAPPPRRVEMPVSESRVSTPPPAGPKPADAPSRYAIFRFPADGNRTLQQIEHAIGSPLGPVVAGKTQRFEAGDLQAYAFRVGDLATLTSATAPLLSFGVRLSFGAVRTNGRIIPAINSAAVAGLSRLSPKGTAQ